MEFLNIRGQQLEATIINVAGQGFVMAAIGDRLDSAAARIYSQQQIEIRSGQEIEETATGKKFAIVKILAPNDEFQQILIADKSNPKSGAIAVSGDRLRRDFEFLTA